MPQSTELILELKWDTVRRIAQEFLDTADQEKLKSDGWDIAFLKSDGSEDPDEHKMMMIDMAGMAVNNRLADIHLDLCQKRWSGARVGKDADYGFRSTLIDTPEGKREMSCFDLAPFGYEDEPYELVGIGMTARYYPTWIDWRDPHGGSGSFRLDAEAMEMIEEARAAIAEVIPEIKDAPCTAAPNFY